MSKTVLLVLGLVCLGWPGQHSFAEPSLFRSDNPNDQLAATPWSVLLYGGRTSTLSLGDSWRFQFDDAGETLWTVEVAYTLAPTNRVVRFLWRLGLAVQLAGNLTMRLDKGTTPNPEVATYIILRWHRFPWNRFVATTFAVGEGLSYAARVPEVEEDFPDGSSTLLNFLTLELTFALPRLPRLQLVYRIHHRSGVFGLFGVGTNSSNAIGLGLRYYF